MRQGAVYPGGCAAVYRKTVKTILDSGAPLAVPMCEGKQGHPILIANTLIPEILEDSGEMGLKGAMDRCSVPLKRIEVDDPGTGGSYLEPGGGQ